jgi:hypothetical protein
VNGKPIAEVIAGNYTGRYYTIEKVPDINGTYQEADPITGQLSRRMYTLRKQYVPAPTAA